LCKAVAAKEFDLHINLNLGRSGPILYAADLTEEYVDFNPDRRFSRADEPHIKRFGRGVRGIRCFGVTAPRRALAKHHPNYATPRNVERSCGCGALGFAD
jgi:hypothetical protein